MLLNNQQVIIQLGKRFKLQGTRIVHLLKFHYRRMKTMNNNQRIYFNITKDQFQKLAFVIQHYQKLYPGRKITSNLIIGALINALFDKITKE